MERRVVHINITNFMAAVESGRDPGLRGRPFIIAAAAQARDVVQGVSDQAFLEGIRPGLPLNVALKRLPGCPVLPPDGDLYDTAQRAIYDLAARFSPTVELRSNGHIFIDLTGTGRIFGHSIDAAAAIKQEFQTALGLDPTTALAVNKVVSKVATRVVRPRGFASVPPGEEEPFMHPQPILLLPGIGPRLELKMNALGILLMGELGDLSDPQAIVAFGPQGPELRRHARGIDTDPVLRGPSAGGCITQSRILDTDSNDPEILLAHLALLCEQAGFLLRSRERSAGRLLLQVQYSDMKIAAGQLTPPAPVHLDRDLYRIAATLLERATRRRVRVRRLTLSLQHLQTGSTQLDLFAPPSDHTLQEAMDRLKTRFGKRSILRASALGVP